MRTVIVIEHASPKALKESPSDVEVTEISLDSAVADAPAEAS